MRREIRVAKNEPSGGEEQRADSMELTDLRGWSCSEVGRMLSIKREIVFRVRFVRGVSCAWVCSESVFCCCSCCCSCAPLPRFGPVHVASFVFFHLGERGYFPFMFSCSKRRHLEIRDFGEGSGTNGIEETKVERKSACLGSIGEAGLGAPDIRSLTALVSGDN